MPDITTGLVGWWKLDEGSGTSIADSSGNSNGGTLEGAPSWGADYLQFDGSSNEVEIANESNFDFENTSSFTVAAWLYFSSSGSVITKQTAGDGWTVSRNGSGELEWQLIKNGYANALQKKFSAPTNTWFHAVCTYDGSNTLAGLKVYIDGVEASSVGTRNDWSGNPSILNDTPVRLGGDDWDWAGRFGGRMRQVRIYNRALTADDADALYDYVEGGGGSTVEAAGTIAATSSLTGVGAARKAAVGTIAATSALSGQGAARKAAAGSIPATSSFAGAGVTIIAAAGTISASATLSGVGAATKAAAGTLAATTALPAAGAATAQAVGTIAAQAAFAGVLAATQAAVGTIEATSELAAASDAVGVSEAAGSIAATSSAQATGAAIKAAAGTITAQASLAGSGEAVRATQGAVAGVGAFNAVSAVIAAAAGTIAASTQLQGSADNTTQGAGSIAGTSTFSGEGRAIAAAAGSIVVTAAFPGQGAARQDAVGSILAEAQLYAQAVVGQLIEAVGVIEGEALFNGRSSQDNPGIITATVGPRVLITGSVGEGGSEVAVGPRIQISE